MLNFPASPPRASGCAGYFGVIRLANTACCVSKLARNDGRKNLHPHSTHRNGRTNAAVSNVRSSTPFLRDRRTHPLRQLGQRGDGKLIDTAELPQGHSANESEQPLVGGGRTSSSTSSRDPTINPHTSARNAINPAATSLNPCIAGQNPVTPSERRLDSLSSTSLHRPLLDVTGAALLRPMSARCPSQILFSLFGRDSNTIDPPPISYPRLRAPLCTRVSALSFFWLYPTVLIFAIWNVIRTK
jgi:hypothetical protein